jgi:hypothetical protein
MNGRYVIPLTQIFALAILAIALSNAGAQDVMRPIPLGDWRAGLTGSNGYITVPLDDEATRTFSIDMDGDGSLDSVYLDRKNGQVIVCFGGASIDCRSYAASLDMFPAFDSGRSRDSVLFIDDRGSSYCVARFDRSQLDCGSVTQELFKLGAAPGTRVILRSSAQDTGCGVLPSGMTRCTGSRKLQRAPDLIGDFSGNGILEIVRVQGAPVSCIVADSTNCRSEPGLSGLAGVSGWGAAQMKPHGATAIFALQGKNLYVCARSAPSSDFTCAAQAAGPELTQLEPWVVRKFRGGTFYDGIAFVPASFVGRGPDLAALIDELNATARRLYDAVTRAPKIEVVNQVDGNTFSFGPSFDNYEEDGCPWCNTFTWSDMWGYYWFDWASSPTSIPNATACLQCDEDRGLAYVYCGVASAVVGTACLAGGTLIIISTGPVGIAGAAIVVGATGICASGAEFLCHGAADNRYANCRAVSCR